MRFDQLVIRGQVGHFHVHGFAVVGAAGVLISDQDHRIEQLGDNGFAFDPFVRQALLEGDDIANGKGGLVLKQ